MTARFDLIIRNGTCVLPWGLEQTSVGVRQGRIAALGVPRDTEAAETIDATGLHVLPGLIDPHVHLRDPGNAAVESIPTGTRASTTHHRLRKCSRTSRAMAAREYSPAWT